MGPVDKRLDDTKSDPFKSANLFLAIGAESPRAPHGTRTSLSDLAHKQPDLRESRPNHSFKNYRIQEPDLPSFDARSSPRNTKSPAATHELLKDTFKNIELFASLEDFAPVDKQNPSQVTKAESSLPVDFINTFNSKDIQFLKEPISNKPVSTKKILYDFESLDCFSKNKPLEVSKPSLKTSSPPQKSIKKLSPQRVATHHTIKPQQPSPKPLLTSKPQPSEPKPATQWSISPPKSRLKTPLRTIKTSK